MHSFKIQNDPNEDINSPVLNIINEKTEVEVTLNKDFDPIKKTVLNPPETYFKMPKYTSILRTFKEKDPLQFQNIMKYFSKPTSRWKLSPTHDKNKHEMKVTPFSKIFFNKRISNSIQSTENINWEENKSLSMNSSIKKINLNRLNFDPGSPRQIFTPAWKSRNQVHFHK